MSLTGEAWSDDRLVRAEVGPRGQLVDLEIDPRVFRKPDSQSLRASILAAASAAVREVAERTQEIVAELLPPDSAGLRSGPGSGTRSGGGGPVARALRTDAEILAERGETDARLR